MQGILGIKKAIGNLNPEQVRLLSERQLRIAINAVHSDSYAEIQNFFLADLSAARRQQSASFFYSGYQPGAAPYDLVIYDRYVPAPPNALVFRSEDTAHFVRQALNANPDIGVALARAFPPFRKPFITNVIRKTSHENAWFSVATALPDIVPNLIELPWAIAEFASDTAFLTANQLRMAFLIAAASDREVGYRQQKSQIASVIAGAFGWRAIARQLIGKIPFGGGIIAKASVAYAGTRVVGLSLERLYNYGYTLPRAERDRMYADAVEQGKKISMRILTSLKPEWAAKYLGSSAPSNGNTAELPDE